MSDWNTPTLATAYATWHTAVLGRDVDALTLQVAAATNVPTGAFRYVRASDKFQEWNGSAYIDKVLSIAGGGTGGASAIAARASLGLDDMATQNSGAVAITGGSLAGSGSGITSLNAGNISSGTVATARLGSGTANSGSYLRGDQTWAALITFIPPSAIQTANFTAVGENYYPLSGSHVMALPPTTGNHGKRIIIDNRSTGSWTILPDGSDTIIGAASFSFNYGQYSTLMFVADANVGGWSIL